MTEGEQRHHEAARGDAMLEDVELWKPARTEPFSPATMGSFPPPYLDVMAIQSTRLLPVTRQQLNANRPAPIDSQSENDPANRPLDLDMLLQSVRLLVEPLPVPDLRHTGVKCQFGVSDPEEAAAFHVTAPNHSFDEAQVKFFYPTGAKNTNIREYIQATIQKHGVSPTKSCLSESHSAPAIAPVQAAESTSPTKLKTKKTKKARPTNPGAAYYSPSRSTAAASSPHKKVDVMASAARLSGSVSTSGLLNPELTRQAKEILTQLRANANKVHDLIGS